MKSETTKELFASLSKAQEELKGAVAGALNPFYNSKYADLESVIDAIKVIFPKHGLGYLQPTRETPDGTLLETWITHSSGQYIMGDALIRTTKQDPQGFIAGLTYMRRSCLASMVGLAQVDDDGNEASGKTKDEAKVNPPPTNVDKGPSEPQLKRLFAITRSAGWSTEQLKEYIKAKWSIDSTRKLSKANYEYVCGFLQSMKSQEKKD